MTERVYVFRVQRGGRLFWQRGGGLWAAPRRRPPALREDPPGLSGIRRAFTMACICRGALASQWVFTRWCQLVSPFTLFSCLQAGCSESASAARESWLKWQEAPRRSKSDCLHSDRWSRMGKSPFYQFVSSFSASWYLFWRQTRLWKAFQRDSTSSDVKMSWHVKTFEATVGVLRFLQRFPSCSGAIKESSFRLSLCYPCDKLAANPGCTLPLAKKGKLQRKDGWNFPRDRLNLSSAVI